MIFWCLNNLSLASTGLTPRTVLCRRTQIRWQPWIAQGTDRAEVNDIWPLLTPLGNPSVPRTIWNQILANTDVAQSKSSVCCALCLRVPSLSSDPFYSDYYVINPNAYKELPLTREVSFIIMFNTKKKGNCKTIYIPRTQFCKKWNKKTIVLRQKEMSWNVIKVSKFNTKIKTRKKMALLH